MTLESDLEGHFAKEVRKAGGWSIKIAPTTAGIPDRLVIMPGGALFLVELKTQTGRVSSIQAFWHSRLAELGTTVHVLYGKGQIDKWFTRAVEEAYQRETVTLCRRSNHRPRKQEQ